MAHPRHRAAKIISLNGIGLALLYAAWRAGWVDIVVAGDQSRLVWVIAAAFLIGLMAAGRDRWSLERFVENRLVLLGLIGTVVGFALALMSIDVDLAGDPSGARVIVASLIQGLGTAIYTTLVGALGSLWLSLNRFLLGGPPYGR